MKASSVSRFRASGVWAVRPRRVVREDAPVLLPPLELYRKILRAHRTLPGMMRELGDQYVKAEFKAHKSTDNPLHIVGFLTQWQEYLQQVDGGLWAQQTGAGGLTAEMLEKMSDDQVQQVYELMQEVQRVGRGEGEGEADGAAGAEAEGSGR